MAKPLTTIPYVTDTSAPYGELQLISPLLRRVLCNNPSPYTYTGTATHIVGNGTCAIIDPGPNDKKHLDAIVNALRGDKVSHILVTHTHRDHCEGARALSVLTGAPIYAIGPHPTYDDPEFEGDTAVEEGADTTFTPDNTIIDKQVFEGPDWTIYTLHTPGHTANHACFVLMEENACFTGDHIMGWSTSIISPPDGNVADYMTNLRRIRAMDFSILRPTHGPAIEAPSRFIDAIAKHRMAREQKILKAIIDGKSDLMEIVKVVYTDVPDAFHLAAARSTLAHIIHLKDKGLIKTKGKTLFSSKFTPVN